MQNEHDYEAILKGRCPECNAKLNTYRQNQYIACTECKMAFFVDMGHVSRVKLDE